MAHGPYINHPFDHGGMTAQAAAKPVAHLMMDFGDALRALKIGHRVARVGWNGKGMWLSYTPSCEVAPEQFWSPANAEWAATRPVQARVRDYITMKTADDEIVPWVASQTDMLANDWMVVA